jgi:hypothetical protein
MKNRVLQQILKEEKPAAHKDVYIPPSSKSKLLLCHKNHTQLLLIWLFDSVASAAKAAVVYEKKQLKTTRARRHSQEFLTQA